MGIFAKPRLNVSFNQAGAAAIKAGLNLLLTCAIIITALGFLRVDPQIALIAAVSALALLILLGRAENGVILLVLTLPLMDMYILPVAGVSVKASDWIGMACILLFVLRVPFDKSLRAPFDPLRKPIIGYIVFGLLSTILMYDQVPKSQILEGATGLNSPVLRTWTQLFWAIYSLFIYVMVYRVIRTKRALLWVTGALLVTTLCEAIYAVSGQRYWLGGGYRVLGTFSEPSYYAEWLVLVIPIAIALALTSELRIWKWVQIGYILLLIVNLILTFSTGGYVSAFIAAIVLVYLSIKGGLNQSANPLRLAMGALVIIIAAIAIGYLAVPTMRDQVEVAFEKITNPQMSKNSAMVRQRLRKAAHMMFLDYPLWGVGPGNYPFFRFNYIEEKRDMGKAEDLQLSRWDPNNLYYEVLSERGIVGGLMFAWIWLSLFVNIYRSVKTGKDTFSKAVLVGLGAGGIGLLVGYYAHANFFRIYTWVYFGLAAAAVRLAKEPVPSRVLMSPGVETLPEGPPFSRRLPQPKQLMPKEPVN